MQERMRILLERLVSMPDVLEMEREDLEELRMIQIRAESILIEHDNVAYEGGNTSDD